MTSRFLVAVLGLGLVLLPCFAEHAHADQTRHYRVMSRAEARHYARTHGGRQVVLGPRGRRHLSMAQREILWGPAEMPPAPHDFGPHYDFPPAPLNGGITNSPYIH